MIKEEENLKLKKGKKVEEKKPPRKGSAVQGKIVNGANWGWAFCERERLDEERVRRQRGREGLREGSVGMEEREN